MSKILNYFSLLRTIVSPLTAFFAGTALACCAYALLTSTLGLRMAEASVSTFAAGIVLSLYYAGYIIASLTSNQIINRVWAYSRFFDLYFPVFGIGSDALFFGQPGLLGHFAPVGRLLHGLKLYVFGKLAEHPGQQ